MVKAIDDRPLGAGCSAPTSSVPGFGFDVEIRRGAGAYICGEETALFESIEGKRGEPRNKPPFPVTHGLFGKPTVVNNVETLINVPLILREGGAAYAAIGTDGSTGPKLFCVSGTVARPGIYEVPFGVTLARADRPGRRRRRTAMPSRRSSLGGAAGAFVGPDELDVPLTFEGTRSIGGVARLRRRAGLRRDGRPARHRPAHRPRSSATNRAASACPAGSAPSARRSCSHGWRPGARSAPARQELALLRANSARRCVTPRSAGSARPRPRRSSRR